MSRLTVECMLKLIQNLSYDDEQLLLENLQDKVLSSIWVVRISRKAKFFRANSRKELVKQLWQRKDVKDTFYWGDNISTIRRAKIKGICGYDDFCGVCKQMIDDDSNENNVCCNNHIKEKLTKKE